MYKILLVSLRMGELDILLSRFTVHNIAYYSNTIRNKNWKSNIVHNTAEKHHLRVHSSVDNKNEGLALTDLLLNIFLWRLN